MRTAAQEQGFSFSQGHDIHFEQGETLQEIDTLTVVSRLLPNQLRRPTSNEWSVLIDGVY